MSGDILMMVQKRTKPRSVKGLEHIGEELTSNTVILICWKKSLVRYDEMQMKYPVCCLICARYAWCLMDVEQNLKPEESREIIFKKIDACNWRKARAV